MAVILTKDAWGVVKAAEVATQAVSGAGLKEAEMAANIVGKILEIPIVKKVVEAQAQKRGIIPSDEPRVIENQPHQRVERPPPVQQAPKFTSDDIKDAIFSYVAMKGGKITTSDLAADWPKLRGVLSGFGIA